MTEASAVNTFHVNIPYGVSTMYDAGVVAVSADAEDDDGGG